MQRKKKRELKKLTQRKFDTSINYKSDSNKYNSLALTEDSYFVIPSHKIGKIMNQIKKEEQKTKFYMRIFVVSMVLLSLVVAIIMTGNYANDQSQERFKLTKEYKVVKKEEYTFDRERGHKLYQDLCAKCHKPDGTGSLQNPPLKGSSFVINSPDATLKIIVKGFMGEITRQGRTYNSVMPSFKIIPHKDLAHVANYIRTSFGNQTETTIHHLEVVKAKIDTLTIKGPLKETDLK